MTARSPLFDEIARKTGLRYGFGDAANPVPAELLSDWERVRPSWKQVHGIKIHEVSNHGQACGENDGLWTRMPAQGVAIVTADCVPILLARKDGQMVAALHAGWRGTRARIVDAFCDVLEREDEDLSQWVAALGPCAHACCYEVSLELVDDFKRAFLGVLPANQIEPAPRKLDLTAINAQLLRTRGISAVDIAPQCTICTPGYYSYRRDPGAGRQWSLVFTP